MGVVVTDLVIDKLTVEYNTGAYAVRPLDSFSVTVPDGSLAVLLGPSGCGKTTLLSCLGGILTPTSGSIHHGGKDIAALRGEALTNYRQRDVGIVFQAFNLVPSLSGGRERDGSPSGRRGFRRRGPRSIGGAAPPGRSR